MKIITPEQFLGIESPEIAWHHGTCDSCKTRLILICHFGYNRQLKGRSYSICKDCLKKKAYLTLMNKKDIAELQKEIKCSKSGFLQV
ncbi:MAG: hypothetical protein AABW88_00510 [Nanoarchaeota archaeon]